VDVQVDVGELVAEPAQQVGQDGQGEGGGEADLQAPGLAAADGPGGGQSVGEAGECSLGGGQQFAACWGEGDAFGVLDVSVLVVLGFGA
jgi:hypothetical protein